MFNDTAHLSTKREEGGRQIWVSGQRVNTDHTSGREGGAETGPDSQSRNMLELTD